MSRTTTRGAAYGARLLARAERIAADEAERVAAAGGDPDAQRAAIADQARWIATQRAQLGTAPSGSGGGAR